MASLARTMPRNSGSRAGFSSLEVFFAIAIFGIALSGLGTTIIGQLRVMEAIERRVYVLAPQGSSIEVVDYTPSTNSFDYSYTMDSSTTDITGPTHRWGARLGVAALTARDGRRSALPTTVVPTLSLSLNSPLDSYVASNTVAMSGNLQDDGTTTTVPLSVGAIGP
jgi:hypothetical protein